MFVGFFEIIDYIKFEANQSCILKTNQKNPRCDIHTLTKQFNCRNIIRMTIIFGGLKVLSPSKKHAQEFWFKHDHHLGFSHLTCMHYNLDIPYL
jgi:hypothetical protein